MDLQTGFGGAEFCWILRSSELQRGGFQSKLFSFSFDDQSAAIVRFLLVFCARDKHSGEEQKEEEAPAGSEASRLDQNFGTKVLQRPGRTRTSWICFSTDMRLSQYNLSKIQ